MITVLKRNVFALAFFSAVLLPALAMAEEVTLPTMPIDFSSYATAGMTVVATVLGAIAGIVVVVKLCQMGLRKLGSAFTGKA